MTKSDRFEASLTEAGRYRLLVDAITDYAIYMLDPSGTITSWSHGAQRLTGHAKLEALGQHYSIFHTTQDQGASLPAHALEQAARNGRFQSEAWQRRKDGSTFRSHVTIDPIRDQAGVIMGFANVTRDITESTIAQQALKRSEQQFKLLVQNVTDYAIYLLDADGCVSSWNPGAQRIKGFTADEVIGQHVSLFYTADDRGRDEPRRALETAARDGRFATEGWRVRKNGTLFMASVVISPIRDDNGTLIGYAKVTRDMTEAKKSQLALEHARDALFQSQKMEAVGQLTGGVAHDFNNILMAVLGGLELVYKRLPKDPHITPLLTNAIQAGQRGRSLTQRMLTFARRQELKPETISLERLVHGMLELLRRSLGPSFTIEIQLSLSLGPVHLDPHQLELVILSLAMNARDGMPDGGPIIISAREETISSIHHGCANANRYVCLSITDRGDGMDEHTLARATEPFFTTRSVQKATGLGLSMAYSFAEQSGGQFILRSTEGEGTVAELWFPVAQGTEEHSPVTGSSGDSQPGIKFTQQPPLVVLVVDDDRFMLMNTTTTLNGLGHRVFTATSEQQALGLLRREKMIDLVIIDHALPGIGGAELAEAIRTEWPTLPIIFATPLADPMLQRLPKPFREEELLTAIGRIDRIRQFGALL